MKAFFVGLIVILALFALCLIIALIVDKIKTPASFEKQEPQEKGDKVYYITNFQQKKKKPRQKKSPELALKGTILKPEQFHKLFIDNEEEKFNN